MSEVHDTLGGLLLSNLPPYPLVRPLQPSDVPTPEPEPEVHPAIPPTALSDYKPNSTRPKPASPPMSTRVRFIHFNRHSSQSEQPDDEMMTTLGRARTPEPANLGMGSDLFTDAKHPPQYAQSTELLDALNSHLLLLSNQPTATVASALAARDIQMPAKSDTEKATLEQLMTEWKKNVNGQWSSTCEEWSEEQARLAKARNGMRMFSRSTRSLPLSTS
ncbi:hypothetical protein BDN71DRAFT_1510620 [Pleurotus eryngii]|uniref:Uncharacterized protein n=1 Tax=Pleurotus eryngii TaxID=5323 RepID=A0A9P5ZQ71_PLEER|nr:hypothetical protein BDN71DRAFT_1514125 [Pleurotus eryngii]KAF9491158.1 hypothetical protein BDN71DRAFT_1510620 [Pleurotus eryngii]